MVTKVEIKEARQRVETRNYNPFDVHEASEKLLKFCDENSFEEVEPIGEGWKGLFGFLKRKDFWLKFIQVCYQVAILLIKRNK